MRLLVTGREGQVSRSLSELAGPSATIVAVGRPDLDIIDASSVRRMIETHRPDVVVNAAAYTAVDRAESDREAAFAANETGAANVARASADAGLPVIQISTDYVFSGTKDGPYAEDDATGPTGVYGASKLAGELAVADANPAHAILRTAWVYSPYGANFVKTMLRLAETRDEVRVVADQWGTPTYASDIANGILAVAARMTTEPRSADWRGVFHMVAQGETNWAGFAREIFRQAAARDMPSANVVDITTADYPTPARRPANSRLGTSRFVTTFEHTLPLWQDSVSRCLAALAQPV